MEIFQQRNAPTLIRQGLRHLLPDYLFLAVTNPTLDALKETFVTVVGAGTPGGALATSSENVHVTVYASNEPLAREVASTIDGLLLSPDVDWGFTINPGGGLITAPDPATGGYLAAVTVIAASPKNERVY